ncbi:MAG: N-acetylmuramoyl-L-alanine amidase [Verrucomicrobiaceae bacterium]|nr:N-acetylmuramoyl-L-alanine amidase [Verrucomicrobiaceae bacterium]
MLFFRQQLLPMLLGASLMQTAAAQIASNGTPPTLAKTSPLTAPPEWPQLSELDGQLTKEAFDIVWQGVYAGDKNLPAPWTVLTETLEVETGNPTAPYQRIKFRPSDVTTPPPVRYWRTPEELPARGENAVLSDVHIALDPGHIGGDFAKMEERYLCFDPSKPDIAVREGNSTLEVALALKSRLEAEGARVSLVRDKLGPSTPARPSDMMAAARTVLAEAGIKSPAESYNGLTGDQKLITVQWQAEKLFYRVAEIRARADRVNHVLKPDLVVCLHLNAESWGDSTQPQYSAVNHFHILINGCYSPQELQYADVRHELLTRIFTGTHGVELPLAEAVASAVASTTGLPPYVYTTPNARLMGTSSYVYARNLLANRIFRCPVIYLEPYVMNHKESYDRLLRGHFMGRTLIDGRLQSSIIDDYARGVARGIISYFKERRK